MTAPAGAPSPFPFPRSTQEGTPIMTDQPSRVTPAEISGLLDRARQLTPGADLTDLIAYHEQKALLLSRIAADLGTTEAHEVAADAWHFWAACAAAPTLRAQRRWRREDEHVLRRPDRPGQ